MTLIKWNPYQGLSNLQREFEDFFDAYKFPLIQNWKEGGLTPAVNIAENKNAYEVRVELPGVSKENVKVSLDKEVLTIAGEKKAEKNSPEENYHCCEMAYGAFTRSFRLPGPVNPEKVDAQYRDGILRLVLPKAEGSQTQQIKIN